MRSTSRRRRFRSLVVVLVLLAALGVVADRVAESLAEDRIATAAQDEATRYDVRAAATTAKIDGFGFLPQLARGEFSRIEFTMQRPTISSVRAEDLTVSMTTVTVPRGLLAGDESAAVTAGSAEVGVRLSAQALTDLAARVGGNDVTLRIAGGRLQASVAISGREVVATVRPQVRDGRIRLVVEDQSTTVPRAFRDAATLMLADGIELPDLPFDAALKQVTVVGQAVLVTAAAADLELRAA